MMAFFYAALNFYLAAQGGGGLNPLNPPPPRRSATVNYRYIIASIAASFYMLRVNSVQLVFISTSN